MATEGYEPLLTLIDGLRAATVDGRIKWEVAGIDTFRYVGSRAVALVESLDEDGMYPFVFVVQDRSGRHLERLVSGWLDDPRSSEPAPWNEPLAALYETARRSALDIDSAVRSLLDDVEQGDTPFSATDEELF